MKDDKWKAIETTLPSGVTVLGYATSGNLMAVMWEGEEGCRWLVTRRDLSEELRCPVLQASEAQDLANVTAIAADMLHLFANLEQGLRDDLGCMAYCLAMTLGIPLPSDHDVKPGMEKAFTLKPKKGEVH